MIRKIAVCSLVACLLIRAEVVEGCPFCSGASQTLSEEISSMDAAAIVKLVSVAPADA